MKSNTTAAAARLLLAGALSVGLSGGVIALQAPAATAAVTVSQGVGVIQIAASKRGTPYRYGASGPRAFDCSGYTQWTFARIGKRLPRSAHQQYLATLRVRGSSARPGDLVFFGGARKYHVGIYAGKGRMWHSPRTGKTVSLVKIWTSKVVYGRVR